MLEFVNNLVYGSWICGVILTLFGFLFWLIKDNWFVRILMLLGVLLLVAPHVVMYTFFFFTR